MQGLRRHILGLEYRKQASELRHAKLPVGSMLLGNCTCEGAQNPEAPADLIKDVVPDAPPALKAALADIQDVVPPEDPAGNHIPLSGSFQDQPLQVMAKGVFCTQGMA